MTEVQVESSSGVAVFGIVSILVLVVMGVAMTMVIITVAENNLAALLGALSGLSFMGAAVFIVFQTADHVYETNSSYDPLIEVLQDHGVAKAETKPVLNRIFDLREGERLLLDGTILVVRGDEGLYFVGEAQ